MIYKNLLGTDYLIIQYPIAMSPTDPIGDNYYPEGGTSDWIGCYETMEEAQSQITRIEDRQKITIGKNKGQDVVSHRYEIAGRTGIYDWYEIEDLRDWTDKP